MVNISEEAMRVPLKQEKRTLNMTSVKMADFQRIYSKTF